MKPVHGILLILAGLIGVLLFHNFSKSQWEGEASQRDLTPGEKSLLTSTKSLAKSTEKTLPKENEPLDGGETPEPESPVPAKKTTPDILTNEQAYLASLELLKRDSPFYFFYSKELELSPEELLQLPETLTPVLTFLFEEKESQPLVFDADAPSTTQVPVLIYGDETLNLTPFLRYILQSEQETVSLEDED